MEDIIKTITTQKGARVSLVQPQGGRPFFRYEAGADALTDSFRYVIRQHGQEDIATVTVNVEVPVEENTGRDYFNQQLNGFIKCMEKLMDGSPATMALTNLLGIDEGEPLNDDWINKVFDSFYFFDYATREGQPFQYKEHLAQYVYVNDGYWEMRPGNDSIEIIFPSSPDIMENDTVIEVRDYQYTEVRDDKGIHYYPTHAKVQLRIKDQPYFSFTLNGQMSEIDTEYHEGTGYPIAFDARLKVEPYNLDLTLRNEGAKAFYPTITLRDRDGCQLSLDAGIMLGEELTPDMKQEHIMVEYANLQVNELTFTGLETLWAASQTNAESQDEIDSMVKIICYYQGEPIGNVRFILEQEAVLIEYSDGTSQDVTEVIKKYLDEYFNNPKPDGSARNKAFDLSNDLSYRAASKQAMSINDSASKMSSKLEEGLRRRVSRGGDTAKKFIDLMDRFFAGRKEIEHDYYYPVPDYDAPVFEEEEGKKPPKIGAEPFPGGIAFPGGIHPGGIVKPGLGQQPEIGVKPELKPDFRIPPGVDLTPEPKPSPKPGISIKPEVKPDIRAEVKPEVLHDIKPEVIKPSPKPGIKPKPNVKPKPAKPEVSIKPGVAAKPEIVSKPKPAPKPEVIAKPKPAAKPKSASKPAVKVKPAVAAKPAAKPVAKAKPAAKPAVKAKPAAKPAVKAKPVAKTKPAAKPATRTKPKTKPTGK